MIDRIADLLQVRLQRYLSNADRDAVLGDLREQHAGAFRRTVAVLNLLIWRSWTTRRLPRAFASNGCFDPEDALERSWAEWTVPLLLGLLIAAGTVKMLAPERHNSLTLPGLFLRSAALLFGAALASFVGVFLAHRVYRDYFQRPSKLLLTCVWTAAIWVPLALLLWPQRAMWFVFTPIPIAGALGVASKRRYVRMQTASLENVALSSDEHPASSALQPIAVSIAVLLEATLLAGFGGHVVLTASLMVVTAALIAWAFTPGLIPVRSMATHHLRYVVFPCFLLTCLALLPFLQAKLVRALRKGVGLQPLLQRSPRVLPQNVRVHTTVLLLAPSQPRKQLVPPPQRSGYGGALQPTQPLHIPFDGSYSFTLDEDGVFAKNVLIERGDPTKDHIHSSDATPLKMEAHQRLGVRIRASCCSSLAVDLLNADYRPGLIEVEARLADVNGRVTRRVSLGTLPVHSSAVAKISINRAPVSETLRFKINALASQLQFNEIDLNFKLARDRNLAGARIKVIGFTLQP